MTGIAAEPAAVLTIGHSSRSLGEFLALLEAHDAGSVVDVRRFPGSRRNPQFSAGPLADALAVRGTRYLHMPGLGGRRRPRAESPNLGWRNASFRAFADYMLTPEFGREFQELLEQAAHTRIAVMCAEALPWRCHRMLICDMFAVRGVPVIHILGPGSVRPHVLTSFARECGDVLLYPQPPADQPHRVVMDGRNP